MATSDRASQARVEGECSGCAVLGGREAFGEASAVQVEAQVLDQDGVYLADNAHGLDVALGTRADERLEVPAEEG